MAIKNRQFNSGSELARFLEVPQVTITRWNKEGMPYTMAGAGRYVYQLKEVYQWLKSGTDKRKHFAKYLENKVRSQL
jgi:predicted site-specific integrase-resolvase